MSSTLLKRSLEIVETAKSSQNQQSSTRKTTNRTINKVKQFPKNNLQKKESQKIFNKNKLKKHKNDTDDKTDENLRKYLMFSSVELDNDTTKKLIQRARTGKYVTAEKVPEKEPEKSAFTEEDFQKFEREFMC